MTAPVAKTTTEKTAEKPTSNSTIQMPEDYLLRVSNLRKWFPIRRGLYINRVVGQVKAVDGVNFYIKQGEILGLVGESGCGNTTTGRTIMRAYTPSDGEILFRDADQGLIDLAKLKQEEMRPVWRHVQMIFQDP